jgi:YidC/Oxa1 family membrane protein insertase
VNIFELLVTQPIFNLLVTIYSLVPGADFGVTIIIFTVIVRFLLYPLTRSMLHQTRAMRKLQPELVRIKKQAGKNKQLAAAQQMELYKKNSINPFRPIGILLIQLPIFFALYHVITMFTSQRGEIARYTYDFLEGLAPIKAVIENPDQFNEKLFNIVDLAKPALHSGGVEIFLVIIALVAGMTQYIMSKQTSPQAAPKKKLREIMAEAAEGKEADQSEMNAIVMSKMTKILPFFMVYIMLILPGALALYYVTSNIVAVIQQHYLLQQDQDELSELADQDVKKAPSKKATTKAREKAAKEATVTRVVAKQQTKKGTKK